MSPTALFLFALNGLAWLAPLLIVVYIAGLLVLRWRLFCSNSLMVGAVGSVLLTTLYLFVALLGGASLIGVDLQAWLDLSGAGFSISALAYAVLQKLKKGKAEQSKA